MFTSGMRGVAVAAEATGGADPPISMVAMSISPLVSRDSRRPTANASMNGVGIKISKKLHLHVFF